MSPARSAQLLLCHWKIEKADGWSDVVQYPLIINSVLCCCGAAGWLETDLCVSQLTSVGSFLSLCLFFVVVAIFNSFYHLYHSRLFPFLSRHLFFSFSWPPSFTPHSVSSSKHPVFSHSLTQRCMSGIIMDHANAHETTRLESHCCRAHGERAPRLPQMKWAFLWCRALSWRGSQEKKGKIKRSKRTKLPLGLCILCLLGNRKNATAAYICIYLLCRVC